jgi:hypothetical protein
MRQIEDVLSIFDNLAFSSRLNFVSGPKSSGKTGVLREIMRTLMIHHCYLIAQQCHRTNTLALLFQDQYRTVSCEIPKKMILDSWQEYTHRHVGSILSILRRNFPLNEKPFFIFLDNSQILESRTYSEQAHRIIEGILRLPEIFNLRIIIVGLHLDWIAFGSKQIIKIPENSNILTFSCYSVNDLCKILLNICPKCESDPLLWRRFLNFFIPSVIRITMNPKDVRLVCLSLFESFCETISKSKVKRSQFMHLEAIAWKKNYFHHALKSIGKIFMLGIHGSKKFESHRLPFIAKCLLLAAYLASETPLRIESRKDYTIISYKLRNLKRCNQKRKSDNIRYKKFFNRTHLLSTFQLIYMSHYMNHTKDSHPDDISKLNVMTKTLNVNVFYEIANLEKLRLLINVGTSSINHEANYYCTLTHKHAKKLANNIGFKL